MGVGRLAVAAVTDGLGLGGQAGGAGRQSGRGHCDEQGRVWA